MVEALDRLFDLREGQLIFLAFGLACGIVAIVALLLLKSYLRNRALRPIGGKSLGGMDLDNLEKMQETGLLSKEETKHIRQSLAKQFVEKKSERKSRAGQLPVAQLLEQAEEEVRQSGAEVRQSSADKRLESGEPDLLEGSGQADSSPQQETVTDPLDFDTAPAEPPSSPPPDRHRPGREVVGRWRGDWRTAQGPRRRSSPGHLRSCGLASECPASSR